MRHSQWPMYVSGHNISAGSRNFYVSVNQPGSPWHQTPFVWQSRLLSLQALHIINFDELEIDC